jgi:hypothetical protein
MTTLAPITPTPDHNSSTPLADTGWRQVTALYSGQRNLSFPGESTPAAGLVITPTVNASDGRYTDGRYTGGWSVLHVESGQHIGISSVPLAYAREAAILLAGTGVDWTAPATTLRERPRGIGRVVFDIQTRVHNAWDAGTPTWWARHSWRHIRPAWLVTTNSTDDGYRLDTWPDLVAWLTRYGDNPWYAVQGVTRESDATWRLTCAAPLCGNHVDTAGQPAVLGDEDDHTGDWFELRHYDRGDVANDARAVGWTRHDPQHWTCPACTAEHPTNPDRDGGC